MLTVVLLKKVKNWHSRSYPKIAKESSSLYFSTLIIHMHNYITPVTKTSDASFKMFYWIFVFNRIAFFWNNSYRLGLYEIVLTDFSVIFYINWWRKTSQNCRVAFKMLQKTPDRPFHVFSLHSFVKPSITWFS